MTAKAQIMIDSDHAIALLGSDLQAGESVCVQVASVDGSRYTPEAQRRAAQRAIESLRTRVGQPEPAFTLDRSQPDFDISG